MGPQIICALAEEYYNSGIENKSVFVKEVCSKVLPENFEKLTFSERPEGFDKDDYVDKFAGSFDRWLKGLDLSSSTDKVIVAAKYLLFKNNKIKYDEISKTLNWGTPSWITEWKSLNEEISKLTREDIEAKLKGLKQKADSHTSSIKHNEVLISEVKPDLAEPELSVPPKKILLPQSGKILVAILIIGILILIALLRRCQKPPITISGFGSGTTIYVLKNLELPNAYSFNFYDCGSFGNISRIFENPENPEIWLTSTRVEKEDFIKCFYRESILHKYLIEYQIAVDPSLALITNESTKINTINLRRLQNIMLGHTQDDSIHFIRLQQNKDHISGTMRVVLNDLNIPIDSIKYQPSYVGLNSGKDGLTKIDSLVATNKNSIAFSRRFIPSNKKKFTKKLAIFDDLKNKEVVFSDCGLYIYVLSDESWNIDPDIRDFLKLIFSKDSQEKLSEMGLLIDPIIANAQMKALLSQPIKERLEDTLVPELDLLIRRAILQ